MCSIIGYYKLGQSKPNPDFIKNGFDLMRHRGPDNEQIKSYDNEKLVLGHQRLSIIDTRDISNQPMESVKSSLIFNGEIYNYKELKDNDLADLTFETDSDTEVLQKGLEKYGVSFLNKINGMFAFALYDKKNKSLILGRDRFGVKPLHYLIENDILYFSSEIKPLISIKKEVKPNLAVYENFLKYTATDYDKSTFVEGILQIEGGNILICAGNKIKIKRWYFGHDFEFDEKIFSDKNETIRFTEELLTDAISKRLRSDVPLCLTLSGGLDSTTIYTLIKERLKTPVTLFTLGHPGSKTDETEKVQRLVADYNDKLEYVESSHKNSPQLIEESLTSLEFPIWNYSPIGYMGIYEAIANKKFKVVIEGHGSDEQLGGYAYIIQTRVSELIKKFRFIEAWRVAKILNKTEYPIFRKARPMHSIFINALKEAAQKDNTKNNMALCLEESFEFKILPIVLRAFDRLTMKYTLESRSPYMDYRVVEFFKKMPSKYKVNSIGSKAILREILKKYKKDFIYRDKKKIGFSYDIASFLKIPANIEYLSKQISSFNMNEFSSQKELAVASINKKDWQQIVNVLKIASLGYINNKYGIR